MFFANTFIVYYIAALSLQPLYVFFRKKTIRLNGTVTMYKLLCF